MTSSSFKERLERLGPVQTASQVLSGSPAVVALRPQPNVRVNAIAATQALARRGLSLLRAKRVVEEMLVRGRIIIRVPKVEDRSRFAADLAASGVGSRYAERSPNIRKLRERLKLTQEQFATQFGLDLNSLQNWEAHRRKLDKTAIAYLRVIERLPEAASEAQEDLEPPMQWQA